MTLLYLGKTYPLEIRMNKKAIIELKDKFYVSSNNHQSTIRYLTAWYKIQARKIIQDRVKHLSQLAGLHYNTMSITDASTRWGSCSSNKNLHFNWKLIMAPPPVIDYVISHELAHLTEMNHSRAFWETVRKMFPLYRQYRTWLKRHGHTLTI
jgi:predicted metal-dependent hydrolase